MENRLQCLSTQKTQDNFNAKYPPLQNPCHAGQEKATYLSQKKKAQTMDLKRNQEGNESWGKFQGNFT